MRSFFRKLYFWSLDLLTKGKGVKVTINDFRLRMPAYYHRYHPKDYEQQNFDFYRKVSKPGITCLDIGAHIGIYSVFMSKYANANVYSFEPTPESMRVLKETVSVNRCNDKIRLLPKAVSEKSGKAVFYIENIPLSEANSLVSLDRGSDITRDGYEVEVVSIDDFAKINALKVDFIKIDAEGVELEILRGAKATFENDRPSGILGIHPFAYKDSKQTLAGIWNVMQGYRLKVFFNNSEISQEEFCNKKEIFDLQFIPAERN